MLEYKTEHITKISEVMKSIFRICGEKKIEMTILNEENSNNQNEVDFDREEKHICFNLSDFNDENLLNYLRTWEETLKKEI
jgi:hypothetical protein